MTYLLIPNGFIDPEVDSSMPPTVWIGAIDEQIGGARLTLDSEAGRQELGQYPHGRTPGGEIPLRRSSL